jgi:SAM-dependent methyltransferase
MATFSKSTFKASNYASFRPVYNRSLLQDYILPFHRQNSNEFNLAVDIGCGTGQVTTLLSDYFSKVVGVDPSSVMLASATKKTKVEYRVGFAETLPVEDHSVDLLTAGQAAHWFHPEKFSKEARRVLKSNGTIALFGYSLLKFPQSEKATQRLSTLAYGPSELLDYWEPGREIIQERYANLRLDFPTRRILLPEEVSDSQGRLITLDLSPSNLRNYLKTWSSYKNYTDKHPDAPNIVDLAVDDIKHILGVDEETVIPLEWESVILLCNND